MPNRSQGLYLTSALPALQEPCPSVVGPANVNDIRLGWPDAGQARVAMAEQQHSDQTHRILVSGSGSLPITYLGLVQYLVGPSRGADELKSLYSITTNRVESPGLPYVKFATVPFS